MDFRETSEWNSLVGLLGKFKREGKILGSSGNEDSQLPLEPTTEGEVPEAESESVSNEDVSSLPDTGEITALPQLIPPPSSPKKAKEQKKEPDDSGWLLEKPLSIKPMPVKSEVSFPKTTALPPIQDENVESETEPSKDLAPEPDPSIDSQFINEIEPELVPGPELQESQELETVKIMESAVEPDIPKTKEKKLEALLQESVTISPPRMEPLRAETAPQEAPKDLPKPPGMPLTREVKLKPKVREEKEVFSFSVPPKPPAAVASFPLKPKEPARKMRDTTVIKPIKPLPSPSDKTDVTVTKPIKVEPIKPEKLELKVPPTVQEEVGAYQGTLPEILDELCKRGQFSGALITDNSGLLIAEKDCPIAAGALAASCTIMGTAMHRTAALLDLTEAGQMILGLNKKYEMRLNHFMISDTLYYLAVICHRDVDHRGEVRKAIDALIQMDLRKS